MMPERLSHKELLLTPNSKDGAAPEGRWSLLLSHGQDFLGPGLNSTEGTAKLTASGASGASKILR
jgi:hypothetical protein